MSRLIWDQSSERVYETGVKNCVLYPKASTATEDSAYEKGVAWNGITAITESPSGAEATALYADDMKYVELMSAEEFGATVEAYTYPDEFAACNGFVEVDGVVIGQQTRKAFGMSYITSKGNADDADLGKILHVIYNAKAAPSEKAYASINDSPEAITFSWELTTTAENTGVKVNGKDLKPSAHIEIDSTKVGEKAFNAVLDLLQGSETTEATLPPVSKIIETIQSNKEEAVE